ncbi:hypothetical protein EV175_003772 [Coemansia sp. RSA 1933]|nr:hypothetical protein EV175_003772 [Coemansia sp. RSA 1933]
MAVTRAQDVPHVEYISQLTRHLVSVPASRFEWPKRGSVALVIRLVIPDGESTTYPVFGVPSYEKEKTPASLVQAVHRYLDAPDFGAARMQILFIQRAKYPGDPWSGHIGFPGGKREPADGSDERTAERETREELGLDLSDMHRFVHLGRLDDTCAYSLFAKVVLAVSAQVYLQICEDTPEMTLSEEIASVHWVDFGQALKRVDTPAGWLAPRSIPVDMAARMFPKYRQTQPLWYRGFRCLFGKFNYTVLPLEYTKAESIIRTAAQHVVREPETTGKAEDFSWKYGDMRFSTDTELYLWGLSLCILGSFVDLSLPVPPSAVHPGYTSVASPWPQMDSWLWSDVNIMINAAHRLVWGPYRRKPWHVRMQRVGGSRVVGSNVDYFQAHFRTLRVAFAVSCVCKALILWISGKYVARLAQKAITWFLTS